MVAGPGYRKALEFLIKDYAIGFNSEAAESIKKMALIDCIKTYMNNDMVKGMAERAAWLGNDETHHTRKWEEKDLNDLKALVSLVLSAMLTELQYRKIKQDMPKGKK
jgi:adenosyl cobinamide kinase/adenosyl cobinamide phosphate guanylyltransferase